ncbi:hypothetical protein KK083_22175 [Fulvivirgaceae bacterium PWU4]|uniref:Uncharacterized protein n=1 Tax=Chryseosolibacter histidini TaxID=2782349 RepID=A0AAP2GRI6_9BACT|nr:hypothetical protein [Chryseosolibacter histidini]MBT1699622.1 hypothetical protein [Chryseosolibacter histidini]
MNRIVIYLESKEVVFHGALILIILYVPHAGHLFKQLEHLDMSFFGFSVLNWVYGIALAAVIEFIILVFIINGYRNTGKFYAVVSFFLNAFYYDYWFVAIQEPTMVNKKLAGISFLVCLTHSLSVWQLSELFYNRLKAEKVVEYWCPECEAGPFPNKRSMEGHISKAHKYYRKHEENGKASGPLLNGNGLGRYEV